MKEGRKEPHTRGLDGLLMRQAASGPKEGRKRQAGVHTLEATKNPAGLNLRGVVMGSGLFSVTSKGGENEKEGEQQAEGKVP